MINLLKRVLTTYAVIIMLFAAGCSYHHSRTHDDLIRYGIQLADQGYWTEAAVHWRMVLDEDPDNVAALNNLGVAAEVTDHPKEAQNLLFTALQKRPDDNHIKRNLVSIKERETKESTREKSDENED